MAAQTYASRNIFSLEVGTADVGKTKSGDPHTRTPYLRLARGAVYALLRVKAAQRRRLLLLLLRRQQRNGALKAITTGVRTSRERRQQCSRVAVFIGLARITAENSGLSVIIYSARKPRTRKSNVEGRL